MKGTSGRRHICKIKCRTNCTKYEGKCPSFCASDCAKHAPSCPQRQGGWTFAKPKGKGKRTISLPLPLTVVLKAQHAAQLSERAAAGEKLQDWDLFWCRPNGSPIDAGDDWKSILRLAEVDKDARVHDARHTAATLLLEQGTDIRVVQAVLGHSQLTTTKRYTHITETFATDAAARMGRALWDE
ncbi:tyrosine-type recombinase/integrase [Nonomuraea sp. NPDC050556]|uniref:tyrosine-type recombinase/integrase n=1 Tax=Nonomuraea sp. NPDC050556 TaxID=3364369 RepID=UPI0037A57A81